jgi:hypothetical protein
VGLESPVADWVAGENKMYEFAAQRRYAVCRLLTRSFLIGQRKSFYMLDVLDLTVTNNRSTLQLVASF